MAVARRTHPRHDRDALALDNLVRAAAAADRVGATLLIEALNAVESPRYPLVDAEAAVAAVRRVNAASGLGNARFLLDLYHLAVGGADLAAAIDRHVDCVGHFPGRGAPGTGALPLSDLLSRLAAAGYEGYVGLEHRASPDGSAASFPWRR